MAFTLLKKIAEKILGVGKKKPAASDQKSKRSASGKPRSGGVGRATAKPRRDGHPDRAERPNRKGGVAHPQNRGGDRSRSARTNPLASAARKDRVQSGRRLEPENTNLQPVTSGGRSIARPHGKSDRRGGRRGAPVRSGRSDPQRQRPGGAVSDEERLRLKALHEAWSPDQFQVAPAEGKKRFQDFDLPSEVMHGIADLGFQYCTPIQALSLEHSLAGKNVAGRAQTGTGKTAAFLVAILTRYLRSPETRPSKGGLPRTLVLAPTRELVIQISKDAAALGKYCGLRTLAVYGGMDYERQKEEVTSEPVDLLVATPGRLLDFVRSRVVDLSHVDTLVIDEADRMLDMGFIPDVRSIIHRLPPKEKRSTMLYSATLSEDVMRLASQWMEEPVRAEVECEQLTTKTVKQIVYVVTAREKFTVLFNHIQQYPDSRILVFCNRKHTTEDVANGLLRRGIRCELLSGDVNQNRRLRVLEDFREGRVRIVVATDVAGRGIHVDDIGFVINFDFPYEPEDYVHRIGRTGRAGASGTAISFADEDESFIIPDIEKYIGEELHCTMLQSDDPLLAVIPNGKSGRGARTRLSVEERQEPSEEATPSDTAVPDSAESISASAETAQDHSVPSEQESVSKASDEERSETDAVRPSEPSERENRSDSQGEGAETDAPTQTDAPAEASGQAKARAVRKEPFIRPRNEPFHAAEEKEDAPPPPPPPPPPMRTPYRRQVKPPAVKKLHTGPIADEWTPGQ